MINVNISKNIIYITLITNILARNAFQFLPDNLSCSGGINICHIDKFHCSLADSSNHVRCITNGGT